MEIVISKVTKKNDVDHGSVRGFRDASRFEPRRGIAVDEQLALGLDLGTACGYSFAILHPNGTWEFNPWFMGLWDLSSGRYDTGNIGFLRLRQFLHTVRPTIVWYEDVKFTPSEAVTRFNASRIIARAATSAELIGAFKQTLVLWCEDRDVHCTGIPIGTIKKRATGKGNANKEDMIRACNLEFQTNFDVESYHTTGADNVADAAWVLRTGLDELGDAIDVKKSK